MLNARFSRFTPTAFVAEDGPISASEVGNRLYEHLISEAHAAAVSIAVVTTAANALNDWRTVVRPADIARFAPDSVALRALLPVLITHDALDEDLIRDLALFLDEMEFAGLGLEAFLDDCEEISAPRAATVHARLVQVSWRTLSQEAKTLIIALERAAVAPLPELHGQNARIISALLSGAANGLKPCLDDAGRLYVPPLPQRRRAPRRAVLQNCLVHGPHFTQTGFVRDASAGGLGLGRISGLKRGDRIRVDFASGRQFHGAVAWVTGSAAGMRFDVALAPTDSLIAV